MRKHILLAEMYGLQTILLEGRMDFLKTKYAPILAGNLRIISEYMRATGKTKTPDIGANIIDAVASFDPDKAKKYTQWLLDLMLKRNIRFEDLDNCQAILAKFDKIKAQLPQEQRDIRRFKTFSDLEDIVNPIQPEQSNRETKREVEQQMYAQAEVVLDSATYKILIPKTKEASCYFGMNTRWCTAATNSMNYFDHYNRQGPLYIILDKANNERWQFHFETASYMDERDQEIDVGDFKKEHPEVVKFFTSINRFFSLYEMYQSVGNTEAFRKQLSASVDNVSYTYGYINKDANIVLFKAKNINDLIQDKGNHTAKWIMDVAEGNEYLDCDSGPIEDSNRDDLLHSLDNGTLLNLGEWMRKSYSEEIAENDLIYDPASVSSILELQEIVEDSDLEDKFRDAARSGVESGTEAEMVSDLKAAIHEWGHIWFQHSDGEWKPEFAWDVPVCIAPSVNDLVEEIGANNNEIGGCEIYEECTGGEISVESPHYGWSDYDEEAAKERFGELIHELLP